MDFRVLNNGTLLATSVVYGLLLSVSLAAGLFGIWLLLLVTLSAWRYGYSLLRYVAQGQVHIPAPDIESMNPVGELMLIWHFIALPAAVTLIVFVIPFGNGLVALLLRMLVVAMFVLACPASIALMGVSRNLEAALNPVMIAQVIRTMGRDYYFLVAACAAVVLVAGVATRLVTGGGVLGGLLTNVVGVWSWLAVFGLIGSALHAHADDFDIPGSRRTSEARVAAERLKHWRSELDLAYAAMRSGNARKGFEVIDRLIRDDRRGRELQFWLVDRMLGWDDRRHALRVAARLIEQLVDERDVASAFELVVRCRQSGQLELAPAVAVRLADFATEIGQYGIADELRAGGVSG